MSKRIGVVTYWEIYNYGSFLQAFALQKLLEGLGYQADVITFDEDNGLLSKVKVKMFLYLRLLRWPTHIKTIFELRNAGKSSISAIPDSIRTKFIEAQKDVRVEHFKEKNLRGIANSDTYMMFICGSDQIWNPLGMEFRKRKFLAFAPMGKRVAYAPSFGVEYIPPYNKKKVKKALEGMHSISIREESGRNLIFNLTGMDPPVVLDPTLLAPDGFFDQYERKTCERYEDYILCYFLNRPTESVENYIWNVASKSGKSIVYLPYNDLWNKKKNAFFCEASPYEFLYLVRNASAVFTDSFHGTAFSVIYRKPFTVFERTHNPKFKQTSRITNILDKLGLASRMFNLNDLCDPFECKYTEHLITTERIKSLNYLISTLNLCESNK